MKLHNKKTGEIVEFRYLQSDHVAPLVLTTYENSMPRMYSYNSLAELNEEWEDYEEPKEYYAIDLQGDIIRWARHSWDEKTTNKIKEIGNYFETEGEAKKAVKKLKAWKRLKENNLSIEKAERTFVNTDDVFTLQDVTFRADTYGEIEHDLNLLFGGEE